MSLERGGILLRMMLLWNLVTGVQGTSELFGVGVLGVDVMSFITGATKF